LLEELWEVLDTDLHIIDPVPMLKISKFEEGAGALGAVALLNQVLN
jgi:hypothetical protein